VSLDAQRAKLKAYAEIYELDLVEVVVDAGQSAKSLDRPGLQRALGMLKAGQAEPLLVVKLDRLTRSVVDLGTLVERYFAPGKVALLSVGEQIDTRSAAGRLVLNVLASVSQWEREAIGERTATAMQYKARGGVRRVSGT
jgi:site-specific DNA recombinase